MNKLFQEFVQECQSDYVGLWSIVREVRAHLADESRIVDAVIALIQRLVTEGGVVAGDFRGELFVDWKLPTPTLLIEIEKRWRALGRDPTIGEVVWLTAGNGEAKRREGAGRAHVQNC